jgi:DNA-binding CsgD family transcriptional regulator
MPDPRFDDLGMPLPSMAAARFPFPVPSDIVEGPDEALLEIVALMYQAAGGASALWLEALGRLRDAFGANAGQITQADLLNKRITLNTIAASGLDLITLDQYEAKAWDDPVSGLIAAFPGRPLSSDLHFLEEVCQVRVDLGQVPADYSRFMIVGHVIGASWCLTGLTKSPQDAPFTENDCARFGALSADFRRIHETIALREAVRANPDAAIAALMATDEPLGLAYGTGDVLAFNAAAQDMLGLDTPDWHHQSDWQKAVNGAANYGNSTFLYAGSIVNLRRLSDPADTTEGVSRNYSSILVLLDFSALCSDNRRALQRVSATFGLTQSEAEVLALLSDGSDAPEIAAARGISLATVKSQLRAVRTKTGKSRREELAALLN